MDVKKLNSTDLKNYIEIEQPDVVVVIFDYHIPLHDAGANKEINNIFNIVREKEIISVLGGKAATFYEATKLINLKADIFIKHDMEKPLNDLFNLMEQNNWRSNLINIENIRYWDFDIKDKLVDTKYRTNQIMLDSFPIPNRDLIDLDDYIDVRTILSSRGCNLKYSFCHVPGFWGNWKGRTSKHVCDEIIYLQNNYNSSKVLFLDDNALAKPQRMKEISKLLIENKSNVKLGWLGTIVSFNEDVLSNMFKAGFRWIHYGAESGDDYQLKTMDKKINAKQIGQVIKHTQNIGFRVRTSWILDMPDLTIDGLKKTEDLILEQDSQEIRLHFLTLRLWSILFKKHNIETKQFIHNNKQLEDVDLKTLAVINSGYKIEIVRKKEILPIIKFIKEKYKIKDITKLYDIKK
ncbi:radical SAM protein [archaeon]|nr:radical SAM protein [archaeon]